MKQIEQLKPRQHRQPSSPGVTHDRAVLLDYLSLSKSNRVGWAGEFKPRARHCLRIEVILTVLEWPSIRKSHVLHTLEARKNQFRDSNSEAQILERNIAELSPLQLNRQLTVTTIELSRSELFLLVNLTSNYNRLIIRNTRLYARQVHITRPLSFPTRNSGMLGIAYRRSYLEIQTASEAQLLCGYERRYILRR
jgi:hypothetical protein